MAYEVRTFSAMKELGERAFAELTTSHAPPFVNFAWLDTLESTGCVARERGWAPLHLGLYRDDTLVGFAPAYVKGNSEGEFVFDHGIARFAQASLGLRYYPKLICAVPFTPATG